MRAATAQETRWLRADLLRRLERVLDFAVRKVDTLAGRPPADPDVRAQDAWLLERKVVAETAMLLVSAEPVARDVATVRGRVDALARRLAPLARSEDIASALCLDPGMACDHAVAHVLLGRLGQRDAPFDALLDEALALGDEFGPERLAHRRLERDWLARQRGATVDARAERVRLADSLLGRPLDVLAASRLDLYAFTHAVMYATDLGQRRVRLPRQRGAIAADAEAALAFALDEGDFDLAAEVLLAWPMLGLRWHGPSVFALRMLVDVFDAHGFLPGRAFDCASVADGDGARRDRHVLATCYHPTYVMGFLCAALLQPGRAPPLHVAPTRRTCTGAAAALQSITGGDVARGPRDGLQGSLATLDPRARDALAPFLLALALRRAVAAANLEQLRRLLAFAVDHAMADAPAPRQSFALLARCRLAQRWLTVGEGTHASVCGRDFKAPPKIPRSEMNARASE